MRLAAALLAAGAVGLLLAPRQAARRLTALMRTRRPRFRVMPAAVVASAGLVLFGVFGVLALIPVIAALAGPTWWRRRQHDREVDQLRRGLAALWRAVAAELRAGRSPAAAWTSAAEEAPEQLREQLRPAVQSVAIGLPIGPRLAEIRGPGTESVRWAGSVLVAGAERGGRQADALDRIADAASADLERRSRERALLAGGRATTRVLLAMPVLGLLLGWAIGADPLSFLLGSSAGRGCLAGAAAFQLAGWWWVRRVTG